MTTENQPVVPEGTEGNAPEVREYSEIEQRAIEMGWRPKEEYDGEDADFIDAKEFVLRKPLYDKISQQSKQIKNVTKALETLKDHYTKVSEAEYNRALAKLKEERKEALVTGDADAFERAEDSIKRAEAEFDQIREAAAQPLVAPEPVMNPMFINWKNRNPWYESTGYMRTFADNLGVQLHQRGVPPEDILKEVEAAVKKEFPTKFSNPNKSNAPNVSSPRSPSGGKGVEYQMTDQEFKVWQTLHRTDPVKFSKENYIADLKKVKGA